MRAPAVFSGPAGWAAALHHPLSSGGLESLAGGGALKGALLDGEAPRGFALPSGGHQSHDGAGPG